MRQLRPYLPGGVFHITARTLNKEHWLEPPEVREFALSALIESLKRTDAGLITYAIMTNHVHVVVRQGSRPIAQLMQPFLRRVAVRVQRAYKRSGRIFGKRYWAESCSDPDYLRQLILYTNLNPQRARMCSWDADYAWTSNSAYLGLSCVKSEIRQQLENRLSFVLRVFAAGPARSQDELHADYAAHVQQERRKINNEDQPLLPLLTDDGDEFWSGEFVHRAQLYGDIPRPALSVDDIARSVLKKECPGLPIDWLRTMRGGRQVVATRRQIIEKCLQLNHRPKAIASYLHISESAISRVRSNMMDKTFVRFSPFPKDLG